MLSNMLSEVTEVNKMDKTIDRTKFAESLKEILMNCDDVRVNTDWFDAVLYAYGVISGNWYLPSNIPSVPDVGEIGITWRGPSDGSCDPNFWVDVDTGTRPLSRTTKSTDKFDPDVVTTGTPVDLML